METVEIMRRSDVFQFLSEEELKELEKICRHEEYKAGATIFKQGVDAIDIYVIEHGSVSILLELSATDRRQIQGASNFDCIGWAATIPPYHRLRTVKALEKTTVLAFNGKEIRDLVDTNPKLLANIMMGVAYVVSKRLHSAFTQLMGVTYQE